jgi:hypothetical protein
LALDTDLDVNTGCSIASPGFQGQEYSLSFLRPGFTPPFYIGDSRDCNVRLNDPDDWYPGALKASFGPDFIEASVPIQTLKTLTPDLTGFRLLTTNDLSTIATYTLQLAIPVALDIKPGDSENRISLTGGGVIPVAITSSEDFDATTVNPETIFLSSAPVRLAGQSGHSLCQHRDVNGDSLVDLVCDVEATTFVDPGEAPAELVAKTFDDQAIKGTDIVRIVP